MFSKDIFSSDVGANGKLIELKDITYTAGHGVGNCHEIEPHISWSLNEIKCHMTKWNDVVEKGVQVNAF